ncbi:MAG TPA: polymer-forming cytoskeletal protein [Flavisolibacter sp.]|jgi:cytoskeletal protein CcmA (bactofilin family)|nr:polymer-forming cytoskeletal protein [Flavisolibacter sp.]
MFNKEKTSSYSEKTYSNSATLISSGTILKGDVKSENDLRIDGTIHGNVYSSSKIIVGPSGFVEGNIEGANADITGKVTGNISVKELLQLRGESNVQGNIAAVKLQIDSTAMFNGKCQMGAQPASVVTMSNESETTTAKVNTYK